MLVALGTAVPDLVVVVAVATAAVLVVAVAAAMAPVIIDGSLDHNSYDLTSTEQW